MNDIIQKLKNKKKIIRFKNINTYRDFVSMEDINTGLLKMIQLKLVNDYNICSGVKIYLPNIINFLNKKFKNKFIYFKKNITLSIYGSNVKLRKKGWKIKNKNLLNEFPD